MAKNFKILRDKMSAAQRAEAAALTKTMLAEMPLYELRHALALSQEQLAETLSIKQGSVSKLERRTDIYISTLRRYIEALGGELDIQARFDTGSVRITKLGEINKE
ncbi:MAG: helix-turn-helix transcriptional regulator [Proteobacteria bacterium]|nr:helix-turn-helix transcriptional regulator [Pseudomonadota bacterium]